MEAEIEKFLDNISRAALIFKEGVKNYLDQDIPEFLQRKKDVERLESEADELRRVIRYQLYSQMLIPESRGDVLGLLENSDNVIDLTKQVLIHFDIEKPLIPDFLKAEFVNLADASVSAVNEMVKADRAFFREIKMVNDYINKVYFYEHEADKLEEKIMRRAFESKDLETLSLKLHIRYFAEKISSIADEAESVCERLSVSAIKRSL